MFILKVRINIVTFFGEGGIYAVLTDKHKLLVAVGGATALAAGVYTTRSEAFVPLFTIVSVSITTEVGL